MPIIITKNGREAEKIRESSFVDESNLQNFIYENPDSVPLYEIEEDIRLLILAREVPTRSGPIDAIGTDANGEVYIIETKLYKNPDKRLVVAQVLDYGASISENVDNEQEFFKIIEEKVNYNFSTSLIDKLSSFYNIPPEDSDVIIKKLRDNLANGKLRFVVLMDRIEKRLKDLITFINRNSRFDIYGVELEFYKYEDFEITIPKLFGTEVKKEITTVSVSSQRRTWNEKDFFEEAENLLENDQVTIMKNLYNYFLQNSDQIRWGTGVVRGSFNPIYNKLGPKSILTVFTDGTLQLNYAWFHGDDKKLKSREILMEVFSRLFTLPAEDGQAKFPTYPISVWGDRVDDIIEAIAALVKAE